MNKRLFLAALIVTSMTYAEGFYMPQEEKTIKLGESVISTTGFEENIRNVVNNVSVITEEDISKGNYKSVADILENVPNIKINQNVFGGNIDMRGQGGRALANVQVLVDGVNINPLDRNHGTLPLNAINVDSISRIEIIPGGGSILYGSGTSGGVVNIITKNMLGNEYSNSIGAELGSYGRQNITASAGTKIGENFGIQLNYDKVKEDGYRKYFENEADYFDIVAKYNISEKQNLSFKYTRFNSEGQYPASLTEAQLKESREGKNINEKYDITSTENSKDEYSLIYNYTINDNLKFSLNTSYQDGETNTYSIYNIAMGAMGNVDFENPATFTDKKTSISPKLNYKYNNGNITFGYDYLKNDAVRDSRHKTYKINPNAPHFNAPLTNASNQMANARTIKMDMTRETNSFFALNRYSLGSLELTQGLRYEMADYSIKRFDHTDKKVSDENKDLKDTAFELGANYLYSDTGNIYARWESSYVLPAPNELVDKVNNQYVINNLKPENYNTYELGFRDYIGNTYIQGTVFYTLTTDEIVYEMQGMGVAWEYSNIDETRRMGAELSASQYIGKFTLGQSLSYIDAEVTKGQYKGKKVAGVARTGANFDVQYEFNNDFNIILNMNYKDKYYLDKDNESGKVNDYFVANLKTNYTFKTGTRIYAGINNLFDKDYYDSMSYSNNAFKYDPAAERNYYVGVRHSF